MLRTPSLKTPSPPSPNEVLRGASMVPKKEKGKEKAKEKAKSKELEKEKEKAKEKEKEMEKEKAKHSRASLTTGRV